MNYLLDTNVISEATKPRPSAHVQSWLAAQSDDSLFLSAVTIGEIRRGLLLLDAGKKKRAFLRWLDDEIKSVFAERILPVDTAVMEHWAQLQAAVDAFAMFGQLQPGLCHRGPKWPVAFVFCGIRFAHAVFRNRTIVFD